MAKRIEKTVLRLREASPWVTAALVVLSANWAAIAVWEVVVSLLRGGIRDCWFWPLRTSAFALFWILVCLLYLQKTSFFRPHTRHLSNEIAEKRKHLVLFLSHLPATQVVSKGVPEGLILSDDIEKDIAAIETLKKTNSQSRWSWEMSIRGIAHHLGELATITLICSKESIVQARLFLDICSQYKRLRRTAFYILARKDGQIELESPSANEQMTDLRGFDFESFDELSHAIWLLLREFKQKGYQDHEIMIDFTSGQKPTSVVAAAITFNRKIKAQYVQTNPPHKALSYEVIYAPFDTGKVGI